MSALNELRSSEDKPKKDFTEEVGREQARLAFRDLPTMQSASFIVALVLSYVVRKTVPHTYIFAWDLLILIVVASRIALYYRFKKKSYGAFDAQYWKKAFLILAFFSGLVWGVSAFMLFPAGSIVLISIFLLALASLAAATTITHSAIKAAAAAWTLPALLLYAVHCILLGRASGYTLAFLTLLYMFSVIRLSFIHNGTVTSAITLKFENLALLEDVKNKNALLRRDIVRRKHAEKALDIYRHELERLVEKRTAQLYETEKIYRLLFEKANDAIFIVDAEGPASGKIVAANETAAKMHGYTLDELLKMSIMDVDSLEDAKLSKMRRELILKGEWLHAEIRHRKKDGSIFPLEIASGLFEQAGHKYVFAIERDITERKKTDEQIKASLKEKEVLLKEVYHRTKNNMQVISALLGLQAAAFENKELQGAFKDMQDRIRAMSLVHEGLYESSDLSNLDMQKYLEDVALAMRESHPESARVSIKTDVDRIPLSIELAIPCGLIINEFLSNSLKHAFPGQTPGEIRIALHKANEDEIALIYADNGIGLPENFDIRKAKTLGLRLINNLVKGQLGGKLEILRNQGTEFKINFNLKNTRS